MGLPFSKFLLFKKKKKKIGYTFTDLSNYLLCFNFFTVFPLLVVPMGFCSSHMIKIALHNKIVCIYHIIKIIIFTPKGLGSHVFKGVFHFLCYVIDILIFLTPSPSLYLSHDKKVFISTPKGLGLSHMFKGDFHLCYVIDVLFF